MNRTIRKTFATLVATAIAIPGTASDLKIDHLGTTNTLVRTEGADKYLMLPVQESNEDARINVIVDGRLDRTIYVRLAKSKVDYSVPFDLSPYKGHNVVLDIVSAQGRNSVREAKEDACWSCITLSDSIPVENREKFRPLFHHTPQWGWMNDPNGMFYKDGIWHLYYQWNPYGSKWQNLSWGHSSSPDLINWTHHDAVIEPNGLGYVFSGSCAVDVEDSARFGKDAVLAMYTSAGTSQMQSLAVSRDNGLTFDIYPGNPVITMESEARDPNMFWNPETKEWTLVLAHALDHEMLIFKSPDMKEWTLASRFGKGLGAQDGVWECPDLFELPVEGTDIKKWILICNINPGGPFGGSSVQYFTGDFDGKTFKADTDAQGKVPTKWLDHGKDNYALVSWSDAPADRRTAIGWMSNWQYAAEVPTRQFRSANTLPREIGLFEATDGMIYASSVPSPELLALRGPVVAKAGKANIGSNGRKFSLPSQNSGICEILMDIEPKKTGEVILMLSNTKGEQSVITYDPAAKTCSFDRTRSGITDFSRDFQAVTVAPVLNDSKNLSLRIYVDRSSIEVFGNDGQFCITNLVFPEDPYDTLSISTKGGNAVVRNLKIYSLSPSVE